MKANTENLEEVVRSNPDVIELFYPEKKYIYNDYYVESMPESATYRIGIILDPCRYNTYNCCMNVFGTPEYPALLKSNLEQERVFKYKVLAEDDEVGKNYFMVNEDGGSLKKSQLRSADDFQLHDKTCETLDSPTRFCQGRNFAYQRSPLRPPCMDNNASINVLGGCTAPNGTHLPHCVSVAYTSNTFIPQCNSAQEDPHCGTYLEIHMQHGTPYQPEEDVIAETQIMTRNVSGYYTTVMPLTWKKDANRVLCSYSESKLRIGTVVYIRKTAPICCCPPPYQAKTRIGSFECPIGPTSNGAFGYKPRTLADQLTLDSLMLDYPFCPIDVSYKEDRMMCSVYDVRDRRHYTRNCTAVYKSDAKRDRSWTSIDLDSEYDGICPYYESCGKTLDMGKCRYDDVRFTFVGRVGVVTAVDDSAIIPQVWVSFNYGRTSYQFDQSDVEIETRSKSMYEIWWVVRSKSWYTVQKRKAFNVTSPPCTFDTLCHLKRR
jgi:hypothetical protein